MGGRKSKSGGWHHRVPDFKLVYCGPKESFPEKEIKLKIKKKVSVKADAHDSPHSRLEQ